jgi:hypothetical protein
MARPIKWNISKERLEWLRGSYTLEAIKELTGFSKSTICLKSKEYGLVKKKKGVK